MAHAADVATLSGMASTSSYDDLRLRIANLRSELASAEALLEKRRYERRQRSSRSAPTALVPRVAKRREVQDLRRVAAVLVVAALLATALVVVSVRALTPAERALPAARVHAPAVVVVPPPLDAPEEAERAATVAPPPYAAAPVAKPAATTPVAKPAATGTGGLTVVCVPTCESVLDNGVERGPGNLFNRQVPAGRHVLALRAGSVAKTLVVDVEPAVTREVRVTLEARRDYGF